MRKRKKMNKRRRRGWEKEYEKDKKEELQGE